MSADQPNITAAERSIKRHMREIAEPLRLTDATGNRSTTNKTGAQQQREREFVKGMCESLFRFTGRDHTPTGLWLRLKDELEDINE